MSTEQKACIDNSKEIWASPDDMKSVRAALYPDGAIGITVHGMGIVMPIEKWFRAADALSQTIPRTDGVLVPWNPSEAVLEAAEEAWRTEWGGGASVRASIIRGIYRAIVQSHGGEPPSAIPRTTDEGMRDKLGGPITDDTLKEWLEQAVREGDEKNGYVGPEWRYGDQEPLAAEAALAAMRRVSKTDEGRNAVTDEQHRANCDCSWCRDAAIRALTTGGK